jgi:uncharacterized membrane protein (DUF4010 family)
MLAEIAKIISIVTAVLGAVGSQAGVDVGKIGPILAQVNGILGSLSGLTTPKTIDQAIADLEIVVAAAKENGLLTNVPAIDEALSVMAKFKVVESNYMSGQVALVSSTFSFNGESGCLIALKDGGPAAQLLGM